MLNPKAIQINFTGNLDEGGSITVFHSGRSKL